MDKKITRKEEIKKAARKDAKRKIKSRMLKIILLLILLFLINLYIILRLFYKGGNFTVTLDDEFGREKGLTIYESLDDKREKTFLRSEDMEFFTDISVDWLPDNIDNEGEGSHNGKNYIAYTFYAENQGLDPINYWRRIEIDDVIKDVDEAIRVMVYRNGERIIYAKPNRTTGQPEKGTVAFKDDTLVMLEKVENFQVGDIDKYTIVIYLEGDDPECTDPLIGGEIKMHMRITEEHIPQEDDEERRVYPYYTFGDDAETETEEQ